jgi:diaminopimelate dehydrogenase
MRLAILGYGNLGRGAEYAVKQNPDVELVAIFTRRNPKDLLENGKRIECFFFSTEV